MSVDLYINVSELNLFKFIYKIFSNIKSVFIYIDNCNGPYSRWQCKCVMSLQL